MANPEPVSGVAEAMQACVDDMQMKDSTVSREEALAVVRTVKVIADTIRELGSVPSGHLYAALMSKMTLHTYSAIIHKLEEARLVKLSGDVLTWVGPR